MQSYLLEYIRTNFNVDTNKGKNEIMKNLQQKTNMPADELQRLFEHLEKIDSASFTSEMLAELNKAIETFYKKSKEPFYE